MMMMTTTSELTDRHLSPPSARLAERRSSISWIRTRTWSGHRADDSHHVVPQKRGGGKARVTMVMMNKAE